MCPYSRKQAPVRRAATSAALVALLVCFTPWSACAAPGQLVWEDVYDPARAYDRPYGVAAAHGMVVVAGESAVATNIDILVRTYDALTGAPVWQDRVDPAGGWDTPLAVAANEQVAVVGGNVEAPPGVFAWVVRAYDLRSGRFLWQDVFDHGGFDTVEALVIDADRVLATGVVDLGGPSSRCVTRAYDARTGRLAWEHRFDGGSRYTQCVAVGTTQNAVIVGGSTTGDDFASSAFVVLGLEGVSGSLRWMDRVDGPGAFANFVTQVAASDDRAFVAGISDGDWRVRAYDAQTGERRWETTYHLAQGAGLPDAPFQMATDGRRVIVAGYGEHPGFPPDVEFYARDWVVNAYDAKTGASLWSDVLDFAGLGDEAVGGVAIQRGQAFVSGAVQKPSGNQDLLLRSYDADTGQVLWQDQVDKITFPPGIWWKGVALAQSRLTVVGWSFQGPGGPPGTAGALDTVVRTYDVSTR